MRRTHATLKTMAVAGLLLGMAQSVAASPMTFNFSVGGWGGGGVVTGTFTGEDLNGDGYISSFLFKNPDAFEAGNPFAPGVSEVSFASATYTGGSFDGGSVGNVTNFTISNDLTPPFEEAQPSLPLDSFFIFNYELGGDFIGDDPFEGILIGGNPPYFVTGPFVPRPFFLPTDDAFISRATLYDAAGGMPCVNNNACAVIHTLDFVPDIRLGGADFTSSFVSVVAVPEPSMIGLMTATIGMLVLTRRRRSRDVVPAC